jgi:hypothetical protein
MFAMRNSGASIAWSMLLSIASMTSSGGRPTTVRRIRQLTVLSEVATWLNAKLLVTPAIHMFALEGLSSGALQWVRFRGRQIVSVLIAVSRLLSMTITWAMRNHAMEWCSPCAVVATLNVRNS